MMIQILVTGANGQVGSELQVLAAQYSNFKFVFTDYKELDITNRQGVLDFFEQHNFRYCLNCAAYTAVDKAESEVEKATAINVAGTENLATACKKNGTTLFHLSTDYVYHNDQNTPFVETDSTNPQSVYGRTKLDGEKIAQQIHPLTIVIRTSWVYSSFGNNFVKTMIRLGKERDQLGIIYDQIGTPTYARSLAKAMLDMIASIENGALDGKEIMGLYHYSNEGVTSWYDFAMAIFELENINVNVSPILTSDYPTAAKRPHFSLLNKSKIKEVFGLDIPHWRVSLKTCLDTLNDSHE